MGVYYYSTATTVEESLKDAQFVIDNLQGYKVSYPVAIDIEDASQIGLGKDGIARIAQAFCSEIEAAGYKPMVYCNEYWSKTYINLDKVYSAERWIARYGSYYDTKIERGVWQAGSTTYLSGITGKVDIDFAYKNYANVVVSRTKADSTYVKGNGFWEKNQYGYWYSYINGGYPSNGWARLNGSWYYFNGQRYRISGWVKSGSSWYYMDPSTGKMQTGWTCVNGNWYYFATSGEMQTGWRNIGGIWYYMNSLGRMVTGWNYINNYWYYMNSSGEMQKGWQNIGGVWYYMYSSGEMAANTWIENYYVNYNGEWVATR